MRSGQFITSKIDATLSHIHIDHFHNLFLAYRPIILLRSAYDASRSRMPSVQCCNNTIIVSYIAII